MLPTRLLVTGLIASIPLSGLAHAAGLPSDPMTVPAVKSFIGGGFGAKHPDAPAQLEQFGRLAGLWKVEQELRRKNGEWAQGAPGLWAWKYTLGGFAVTDLWFQPADGLPVYMADLGRDYLLSAVRIFEVRSGKWRVAWMSNGAGKTSGMDFGTFEAVGENDEIIMNAPPVEGMGLQRIVFSGISDSSFRWRSEYSQDDGKTWAAIMRMHATRVAPAGN